MYLMTILRSLLREKTVLIDLVFIFLTLCIFLTIFILYSPKELITLIIEWNLGRDWSRYWWGLYLTYLVEIFFIVLFWDLLMYRLFYVVHFLYSELTHCLITKRWMIVKIVRLKYGFDKLYYYIRPGIIRSSSQSRSGLIDEIMAPLLSDWIKFLFFLSVSVNSILAAILTFLTYDESLINNITEYSSKKWADGLQFLWDNFTKLSTVVVFVLLIFLWYFVSSFGVRKRAIAQANKKKLEDVIQLFRKLDVPISDVILKGSENIQYAINCYESILEFWMFNNYPGAFIQGNRNYLETTWKREGSDFLFKDITELNDLLKDLEPLSAPENKNSAQWFSRHKFELVKFTNITTNQISNLEKYERLLFTKKGFNEMTEKKHSDFQTENYMEVEKTKIKDKQDFFVRYVLNRNIVQGIELLYAFYRYTEVINTTLHMESDKLGRGVRLFTGKE